MLQLTFHGPLPPTDIIAHVHTEYSELKAKACSRRQNACLSVTFVDQGADVPVRHRVVFASAKASRAAIRVVTESPCVRAALESGFAVLRGSTWSSASTKHTVPRSVEAVSR